MIGRVKLFCCSILLLMLTLKINAQELIKKNQFFAIERLSPNIYVFIPPRPMADMVHGNCTILIGNDGVFVIDSFGDHIVAGEAIKEIKKITNKPVKYILTTHWHYDHLGGNRVFKMNYPNAIIICHKDAITSLNKFVIPNFKSEPQTSKDLIAVYAKAIKTGMKADSTKLTVYERETRYPETLRDLQYFVNNFSRTKFSYQSPDITFGDSLTLNMGTDTVKIFHPGWGHSPDDAMVYIPAQNILVTGDIVVIPVPYAFNTVHNDWINILKRISEMNYVKIIVPGHGEILRNKNYINDMIELLEAANQKIEECFEKGYTRQETADKIDMEVYRQKFAETDPVKNWAFKNYFLEPRINNYYKEKKNN